MRQMNITPTASYKMAKSANPEIGIVDVKIGGRHRGQLLFNKGLDTPLKLSRMVPTGSRAFTTQDILESSKLIINFWNGQK